jgi:CheY-like chemotaxis protein
MIGLDPLGPPLRLEERARPAARGAVLVVDDHPVVAAAIAAVLGREGYAVTLARDGREAVDALRDAAFDLVVTDIVMPRMDGIELIGLLRREHPGLPVVAISGDSEVDPTVYLRIAGHFGVRATLAKPFGACALLDEIRKNLANVTRA